MADLLVVLFYPKVPVAHQCEGFWCTRTTWRALVAADGAAWDVIRIRLRVRGKHCPPRGGGGFGDLGGFVRGGLPVHDSLQQEPLRAGRAPFSWRGVVKPVSGGGRANGGSG